MDRQKNTILIKRQVESWGASACGIAEITPEIKKNWLLPAEINYLNFGIAIAYRLSRPVLETISDGPNQLYYFHYQRVNIFLDNLSLRLVDWIQKNGFNALPIPASQVIDWEKQLGAVSHREIGYLAGLGFPGRNNLLVHPLWGSQFRLATVLTDMPLVADKPVEGNCGQCQKCISVCPARAISLDTFNLAACYKKLQEFKKSRNIGQLICGVCLKVCSGK